MKTKVGLFLVILFVMGGCYSPQFLPNYKHVDQGPNGSFIQIKHQRGLKIRGELISVSTQEFVVLSSDTRKCVRIPRIETIDFTIQYAKVPQYGWTIPLYSLSTATHGFFAIISLPVNLITTIIVTATPRQTYLYKSYNLNEEQLQMMARFPQGIPPGLLLEQIH